MPPSFSPTTDLTCPRCGTSFRADAWLIIDAAARPDLLEQARQGTLHQVTCPQCGHVFDADQPLLLYFPPDFPSPFGRGARGEGSGVRVLFSPAQQTTAEQDRQHARHLVERLKESLGSAWRDEWLANGLPAVPRPLLPLALTEGLEAVQQKMREAQQVPQESIRLLEEAGDLGKALVAVLNVRSAEEHRAFLEQHPELYAPEGLQLLERLLAVETRPHVRQQLEMFLQIHRLCQELGLEQTFAAVSQAAQLPTELREVLEELARRGAQIRSPEDLEHALEENPDLRKKRERAARNIQREPTDTVPGDLRALLQEIASLRRLSEMPRKVELCQRALSLILREQNPPLWAALHVELANALAQNPQGSRAENLEQAIFHYQQALEVYTRQAYPEQWAMTQNNLANAYLNRIRGERAENLEQAIFHYQQALEVYEPQKYAQQCKEVGLRLARLLEEKKDWSSAANAYRRALEADALLFTVTAISARSRQEYLRANQGWQARAAFNALRSGNPAQAVAWLESGRARQMAETLQQESIDLERLAALGYGKQQQAFREARDRLRQMYELSDAPNRPGDWLEQADAAYAHYEQAMQAIQSVPGFEYFLRSLPFDAIQEQAEDAPLVYLAATEYGGFALIVRAGAGVDVLELPELTEEALREKVVVPKDDPAIGGYLGAYWRWLANIRNEAARQAWFDALEAMLTWLGQAVMSPLVARLEALGVPQGSLVRLIPGGWLGLLPLHAGRTTASSCPTYALDHYTFTSLPSAQALYHASAAAKRPAESLLLVDNPDGSLVFSGQEAEGVRDVFPEQGIKSLKGPRAAKERVRQAMSQAEVLHFSTHGRAGWTESERAGVLLAGGEWLTLPEIFALRLEKPRLAVLSACETGVPTLKNPDEVEALPTGLMQAGVPGVVGSLWAVNDLSTALLMTWFYHFWRKEGMPLPQSLRRAQCCLRDAFQSGAVRAELEALAERAGWRMASEQAGDFLHLVTLRDFAHPYYWAGFTYTGL